MKRKLIISVCALLATGIITGQTSIEIHGLKRMDSLFLTQFITGVDWNKDAQRLRNIPGIGNAQVEIDSIQSLVRFRIEESITLLPIVNFGRVIGNRWYRLGVGDANFMGRGKQLSIHYQNNDGLHSGQIYYKDPYYKGIDWGYSVDINRWASLEPLFFDEGAVNYSFTYQNVGASIIRNFGFFQNLEIGGNYFVESYKKIDRQILENPPGPQSLVQPKFLLRTAFTRNRINYNFFLLDGLEWKLGTQNVYNIEDRNFFNIVQFQLRKFKSHPRFGNFAMRLRLAFATNNYSPFAPFVADSQVNLRGIGNRIDRGTGQFITNLEYRKTLLNHYPIGIQAVVFTDFGTWRNPGGSLLEMVHRDTYRQFVGGGVRLIYQHIFGAILRIDYGIEITDARRRGFVIGLGQYF